jgi:hypothetical protein
MWGMNTRIMMENLTGRGHFADLGVDRKTVLKPIFKET